MAEEEFSDDDEDENEMEGSSVELHRSVAHILTQKATEGRMTCEKILTMFIGDDGHVYYLYSLPSQIKSLGLLNAREIPAKFLQGTHCTGMRFIARIVLSSKQASFLRDLSADFVVDRYRSPLPSVPL